MLRAEVSALIADEEVDVILTTGSTGLTGRDVAPEALEPLFDKAVEGFGELFRAASVADDLRGFDQAPQSAFLLLQ